MGRSQYQMVRVHKKYLYIGIQCNNILAKVRILLHYFFHSRAPVLHIPESSDMFQLSDQPCNSELFSLEYPAVLFDDDVDNKITSAQTISFKQVSTFKKNYVYFSSFVYELFHYNFFVAMSWSFKYRNKQLLRAMISNISFSQ